MIPEKDRGLGKEKGASAVVFPRQTEIYPNRLYARTRARTPGGYQGVIPQPPTLL